MDKLAKYRQMHQDVLANISELCNKRKGIEQELASLEKLRDSLEAHIRLHTPAELNDTPPAKVPDLEGVRPETIAAPRPIAPPPPIATEIVQTPPVMARSGITDAIRTIMKDAEGTELTPTEVRDRLVSAGFKPGEYSNFLVVVHNTLKRLRAGREIVQRKLHGKAVYTMSKREPKT